MEDSLMSIVLLCECGASWDKAALGAMCRRCGSSGNPLADHRPALPTQPATVIPHNGVAPPGHRTLHVTRADTIKIRPVHWLWADRIALGTLALLAGREGIGKSTIAYQLAADLTRGRLPGTAYGKPRAVIVAATEDSWEHTIVPRLMAAGANLRHIYQIDVTTADGFDGELTLPIDLSALEELVGIKHAALVLLDPMTSRLGTNLDTHKDADVRQALEPLVKVADRSGASILGIIHINKSTTADPLTMVMGSRAFAAVARAVLFCAVDPDDEETRVLGQPKNNLGRTDLPTLGFSIVTAHVPADDGTPIYTGRVEWTGESTRTLSDVLDAAAGGPEDRTAIQDATEWLTDYLTSKGGTDESAAVKQEGRKAGHSERALGRARRRLKAASEPVPNSFPRRTYWTLPGTAVEPTVLPNPGESSHD
jgi:hypothetical protein